MSSIISCVAWIMYCMDSRMNNHRRLSLAFLLVLLLMGLSGHLIAPLSGSHHFLSESTCALHHSIDVPANLQPSSNEWSCSPVSTKDDASALDLVLPIPHPPTF